VWIIARRGAQAVLSEANLQCTPETLAQVLPSEEDGFTVRMYRPLTKEHIMDVEEVTPDKVAQASGPRGAPAATERAGVRQLDPCIFGKQIPHPSRRNPGLRSILIRKTGWDVVEAHESSMQSAEDRDLMVSASRNGSVEALTELVRRWDHRVLAYLTKATGDPDAARDLRQDVFLRVHRYGMTYDPRYAFSTWLFRIAGNALSTWRSKREQTGLAQPAGDDVPDSAPNPMAQAARAELDDQVQAAIVTLPPTERELLLQRFYLDMSYREIAEIQGVPETTVKSRTYAVLQRLRQSLGRAAI